MFHRVNAKRQRRGRARQLAQALACASASGMGRAQDVVEAVGCPLVVHPLGSVCTLLSEVGV